MAIWTKDSGALATNNSYIKYRIRVILESQNVANNTSNVTVQVQVWRTNTGYTTRGTGTVYVTINGTNYSAGIASSQHFTYNSNTQIFTRNLNVSHGADGAKTLNTSARISHSQFSSSSQSYNPALNTIPRASTLSAFSFASHLKPSTAVNINYTVDRKSDAFRHQIQLRDGSHVVQTWDNVSSNGSSTVQLSTNSVNSLLNRMRNVTSRSLTLRVATRSGVSGGWIGGAVTRNATASIDATIKPTVGALSVSQTGNSVSTHYLQGISKIKASFTRSGGYGATITNSSITVRRKTTNNDVQTINSNSGTTGKTVSLSGTYEARGMARDSRGRISYTAWKEFTVTAYTSPIITTFTAVRNASTPTTVNIARAGTHSHLGGKNILTYTVQRRIGTGSWTNVNTNATGTSITASFSGSSTSTSNSVASSYEFRMIITDKFGESAESVITVSTQRVVLDIHKNEGVGIGKIHEKGTLDVDGEIFLRGMLEVEPPIGADNRPVLKLNSGEDNGFGFLEFFNNVGTRAGYLGVATALSNNLRNMITLGADPLLSKGVNFRGSDINFMDTPVMEYGTGGTNTGYYIRFYNGLQVCWGAVEISGTALTQCNMGATFKDTHYGLSVLSMGMASSSHFGAFVTEGNVVTGRLIHIKKLLTKDTGPTSTVNGGARYLAIGMWK